MKVATGHYINVFSEVGYDNLGLSGKYDIFVIFPECFSEEECSEQYDKVVEIIEGSLKSIPQAFLYERKVKEILSDKLIGNGYDVQVIVQIR